MSIIWYYINITFFTGDIVDCHPEETLSTKAEPRLTTLFEGWQSTMSPHKECYIYFIIPNVPFLQQIWPLWDIAVWHYINITFTIYYVARKRMLYLFYYTECPISTTNFATVRHCRVTFKIVTRPIDQSDCWKLTWGIIIKIVTRPIDQSDCWKLTWGIGMFAVTSRLGLVGREATTVTPFWPRKSIVFTRVSHLHELVFSLLIKI